jgi:hypothetical protein
VTVGKEIEITAEKLKANVIHRTFWGTANQMKQTADRGCSEPTAVNVSGT